MSPAWKAAKAARAARREGFGMQPRDNLGFIILRDGRRQFDTWRAWAVTCDLHALPAWDLRPILQQLPQPQRRVVAALNEAARS